MGAATTWRASARWVPQLHGKHHGIMPVRSRTPLGFSAGSRAGRCFGRIGMRSFLSSPLVVVGKGLKLPRNGCVGHGLGGAEQSPCCLQIFLASL